MSRSAKLPSTVRPDRFALVSSRDTEHGDLVDREGEVIGPELGDALEERAIGLHGLLESSGHLGDVKGRYSSRTFTAAPLFVSLPEPDVAEAGSRVFLAPASRCWRRISIVSASTSDDDRRLAPDTVGGGPLS